MSAPRRTRARATAPRRPPAPPAPVLRTGVDQRAGGKWQPGQSGNPGGRPSGERALLRTMYGDDGAAVYRRLERLRNDRRTPLKLKAEIDFFIIERLFGKAAQSVDVTSGGASLAELIAAASGSEAA